MAIDPKKRLSAAQALKHPWIQTSMKAQAANISKESAIDALTNLKNFKTASKL